MLGDSGVAVHPEDERYKHLVGLHCVHPLTGHRLPIVADAYADPEQGTGAVKMTPAHDFNDFEVGRRHDLELINIFTRDACINGNAPEKYRGMDRFAAREAVVADMEALGLLAAVEEHDHVVPHGDRGGVPIEPFLTDQWYVNAKNWQARPSSRCGRAGPNSCRNSGARPITSGWKTSSPGASRGSCGGVTAFRPGTGRMGKSSWK